MNSDAFRDGHVEVAGERIRYRYHQAGHGPTLVHLQPGDAPDVTAAHALLARRFRVLVVAVPAPAGASTLVAVVRALGVEPVSLVASAGATPEALRLMLEAPACVQALVLEAPVSLDAGLERRLPEIAAPALVLAGTRDAEAAAPARACRAGLPNGHLVYVYGAGAAIAADRPQAFAEVVGDFLERRDAFVISAARTVINP